MSPEEKKHIDAFYAERLKHERAYLEANGGEQNEHGVYIYKSADGNHSVRLDSYLRSYRDYLIENGIVKEK